MLRASRTRPCSNGVFSVTYFSTKTSNESFRLGGLLLLPFKFSICSSCVLSVCRSRSERLCCETCADFSGLLRCLIDGKLSSISKSWIPDSLWDCWEDRSLAGLEEAKHPESRGNLCRSNWFWLASSVMTFLSVSSSSLIVAAEAEKKNNLGQEVKKKNRIIFCGKSVFLLIILDFFFGTVCDL